jgi:hypothetical protein
VVNSQPLYNFGDAEGCPTSGDGTLNRQCIHNTFNYGTGPKPDCTKVPNTGCWKFEDIWYVSTGVIGARALPQIYRNDGSLPPAWYQISLYGAVSKGQRVFFDGTLTQYQACKDVRDQPGAYIPDANGVQGCVGNDQVPEQGYQQLWTIIQQDTRTQMPRGTFLRFSTDIRWTKIVEEY